MNSKKWVTLVIMSLSTLMATVSSSSLNAVLPYFAKILNLTFNQSQMILIVYLVVLTSILTICGWIADIAGHKKIFLSGTIIFGLSSAMVFLGDSPTSIILMRIIQAVGASLMVSSGPAILFGVFEPERRGFAIGIHTSVVSLGLILGPPTGGFILKHLSWHWLFLINIPISLLSFFVILFIISDNLQRSDKDKKYDFIGMIMWMISIPLILLSLPAFVRENSNLFITTFTFITGMIILISLFRYEQRINNPFFPINLIRVPAYYGGLFSLLLGYTALFIPNFLIPFYLNIVLNLEPQQTGLLMSTTSIAMFATTGVSGYISDRTGYYKLCISGMILLSLGIFLLVFTNSATAITQIIIAQIIIGAGLGIFNSPNTTAMLNIGGDKNIGITTGLLATMRNMGMSIGTAIAGFSASIASILIFNESAERINSIPKENFITIFRLTLSVAFIISVISIYLSGIRKGTDLPSTQHW